MKSMIRVGGIGAALLLGLLATAAPMHAQTPSTRGSVAYINIQDILGQTPEYSKAESLYTKEFSTVEAQARQLNASLDSARSDFERQSTVLTPTQRTTKRKALDEYFKKTQEQLLALDAKMAARRRELLEPIHKRINSVVEGIRAAGGYAMVFDVSAPNSPIVTADTSLDLTAKVVQQLKSGN